MWIPQGISLTFSGIFVFNTHWNKFMIWFWIELRMIFVSVIRNNVDIYGYVIMKIYFLWAISNFIPAWLEKVRIEITTDILVLYVNNRMSLRYINFLGFFWIMLETPQCFIINAHELKAHHVQGDAQWIII